GGGYPDPVSFPYEGMIEATAKMMAAEGAAAMTYGEPQGYLGLRELICHKYQLFEMMKAAPENIVVANGSGQALSLAFSAFVDPGDPIICEAPTFAGSLNTIRRHGPRLQGPDPAAALCARSRRARDPGGNALEDPRRRRAAGLALRAQGDDPAAAVVPLRRRHQSVHVARGHVLPQGQSRAARAAADRRLSRHARRHAARTGRGARGHRRRDQPS